MVLHIVTSHWKEDLTWLTKSKFPVILIDKEGADPSPITPQHVITNQGMEASAYLKYIVENYDSLPDAVAFIHGHETSPHQRHTRPLLELIESANVTKYGFIPINNYQCAGSFTDWEGVRFETFFRQLCIPLKEPVPYTNSPWIHEYGAQFVVSRDRILKNPKMLYEGWLHIMMTQPDFSSEFAYILERSWHVIFGEGAVHLQSNDWFN
jgi:hypothetical protein